MELDTERKRTMGTRYARTEGIVGRPRGRYPRALGVALALVLALGLLAPAGTWALRQVDTPIPPGADAPSPAEGHAEVIAHGVARPPERAAWRVVQDTAEPIDEALPEERALGFALADEDPILVNDLSYSTQTRLGPGEAAFAPSGTSQQRTSLTEERVPYYRLALVSADQAGDDGGDELLLAGDAFTGPTGLRDIDLTRDVLAAGGEGALSATDAPALVLVTAGEIEVTAGDDDPVSLAAGEAATFEGDLLFTNPAAAATADADVAFVVATVGAEVPPTPRFSGSITVEVRACPEGMTADDLVASECEAVGGDEGFDVELLDADESPVATDDGLADGAKTWGAIPFGTYTFGELTRPSGFDGTIFTDADGAPLDEAAATISRANPDVVVVLFNFRLPTGSLTVQVRACPEGQTPETVVGDFCDAAPAGFGVTLTSAETGETLTLDDAAGDGVTFTWTGLTLGPDATDGQDPRGVYELEVTELPAGYTRYLISGPQLGEPDTALVVRLTAEDPEPTATVFLFPEEDAVATPAPEETGSVTIALFTCQEGDTPDAYDPEACAAAETGGFDVALRDTTTGTVLGLADADGFGAEFTWDAIPLSDGLVLDILPPEGYDAFAVAGDVADGSVTVLLDAEAPDASVRIYFFPAPTTGDGIGTVAVGYYACPAAGSTDQECLDAGLASVTGTLTLTDEAGTALPERPGGAFFVWGDPEPLPAGDYTLDVSGLTPPDGYVLDRVLGAEEAGDSLYTVTIDETAPDVTVSLLYVPA